MVAPGLLYRLALGNVMKVTNQHISRPQLLAYTRVIVNPYQPTVNIDLLLLTISSFSRAAFPSSHENHHRLEVQIHSLSAS